MFADVMAVLVESCVRASVVLGVAWALTSVMRRASASTRHFLWSCAIAGSLLASVIGLSGPRWTVPLPSAFTSMAHIAASDRNPDVTPAVDTVLPTAARLEVTPLTASSTSTLGGVAPAGIVPALLAVIVWVVGALVVLAYVLAGAVGAWWIRRSAVPLQAPWVEDARVLAEAFEIRGSIVVVESETATTPMVCGVWRPIIVMPTSTAQWSDERRRVVVLHELAHIKRRDCLTQAVAQIVCAVYWFNPLAWLAARRLRTERERACDDFVLAAGAKRADYAAHLLDIAQTMRRRQLSPLAGVAMARPSQLEGRLLAILDPAIRRSSTRCTRLASVASVLLITMPVGAVRLQNPMPIADEIDAAASVAPVPLASLAPSQSATPSPTPAPAAQPRSQVASGVVEGAITDRVSQGIADALGTELAQEISAALAAQSGVATDPKAVEALIGALADPDPDVREMVVVTLGRMRDPRVVDALLPLLKDGNADVREQAVAALVHTRDPRAAAAVATMIDDSSPDVREQAVQLLGRARNREAVPALLKALKDASADVREQAAYSLGQIRDVSAVDPLLDLLKDSSPDVREQTVHALGQIRNGRAVDGLIVALKDSSPDVREQAAHALGQIRDPRALPSLAAALRDADADVREQAAHAIGQISGQE